MNSIHILSSGLLNTNTLIVPVVDQYVFIVDPAGCSLSSDEKIILTEIEKNHYIPLFVLLTHGHFDHILGLSAICKVYHNIPIFLHSEDTSFIDSNSFNYQKSCLTALGIEELLPLLPSLQYPTNSIRPNQGLGELYSAILSNQEVNPAIVKVLNTWYIYHTPGHTKGSVCLYSTEKKIIISGDTLLYNSVGRTDLIDGDPQEQVQTIDFLLKHIAPETIVIPGHGYTYHFGDSNF